MFLLRPFTFQSEAEKVKIRKTVFGEIISRDTSNCRAFFILIGSTKQKKHEYPS